MSIPNSSASDALSRTSAATASFLSSFSAGLGAGGALSGLFESLLAGTETLPATPGPTTITAANSTVSPASNDSASSNDSNSSAASGGMNDLFSQLQNFVNKWSGYANNQSNGNNQQQNASTSGASSTAAATSTSGTNSSATRTTTAVATASASATPATTPSSTGDSTSASTSDPNAPPSFADLLAQLQAIVHMLQKQIQAAEATTTAGGTQTTAANGTSTGATPQDLLAAGGALSDLLALGQNFEKKFGITSASDGSSAAAATAANAGGGADPVTLAALDTQIRANLKTLLDKLQTATAANASPATGTTVADSATTSDVSVIAPQTASLASTDVASTSIATADAIITGALSTADDFIKQLNNLYGSAATATAITTTATAAAVAATNGNGGSSLDADPNNGGANAAANPNVNGATGTDTANAAAESPKSANPYSFASQLSAARAQNGGTTGLPSAVDQVLLQLNKNAKSGNDQMSVQLHPADLGTINIKLDFGANGTVSGTVVASNADTLSMLQKDSRSLERALQEAGLRADPGSLQFSLGGQSNGNNQGQGAPNQPSGNGGTASTTGTNGTAALVADVEADTTQNWVITPGRVNITV